MQINQGEPLSCYPYQQYPEKTKIKDATETDRANYFEVVGTILEATAYRIDETGRQDRKETNDKFINFHVLSHRRVAETHLNTSSIGYLVYHA